MDLRQLMLGDLVHIKLYRPDENLQPVEYLQPVRVAEIGGIVTVEDISNDKEPYRILEGTEIEQIPLTHEIMAKNFSEKNGRGYFYFDDFIELSIWEVNDGIFLLECDHVEFSSMPGEQIMVSTVHELQHFLRHICYDKEIEL